MTLDTDMKQILIYFGDDINGLYYHHRCLAVQGPAGCWVGITPTHDVQVVDVNEHAGHVYALRRASPFPRGVPPNEIFAFDAFEPGQEEALRDECLELAALLGYITSVVPVSKPGKWRVADPGSDLFGQVVPDDAMGDPNLVVTRESSGLVQIDGKWIAMERVTEEALPEWQQKKWTGAGRDPRIAGCRVDTLGRRHLPESEALSLWRPPKEKSRDNPLQGPSVIGEYFEGLRVAGVTLTGHDQLWRARSGVPETGLAARFHSALSEVLRYMITVDQLDPTNLVSAELATRYLVMIEAAVDRNPRQPEWDGLEVLTTAALSQRGSVELPRFNSWVSSVQKDKAVVMKQGRLLREERAAEARRRGGKEKEKGGE